MRNPKFLGVFSRKSPGQSARSVKYFAWQLGADEYAVQELDGSFSPRGQITAIGAEIFNRTFRNEASILAAPITTPDFRQIVRRAETVAPNAEDELALLEKARQAKQVETDLRGSFDKAIRALNRTRDRKGAIAALERIAAAKNGIVPEHRHMFRDFGVALRKKSMPELALKFARRAVALSPHDDHAKFNLARILGMMGQYEEADNQLREALQIDPTEKAYGRLVRHIAREREFSSENRRNER